jgi:hypothetical protein
MVNIVSRLVGKFGTQAKLGEAAQVSQGTVSGWQKHNRIPSKRQELILAWAREHGIAVEPADFFPPAIDADGDDAGGAGAGASDQSEAGARA